TWQQQYPAWQPWGWTPPPWAMPPSTTSSQTLTDIEVAMHTMSLRSPDNQWYMDTGATSHTAASHG
ncbi:hypothetical protein A2U01_0077161, partial [Trifolium medium]|nr:hypothetical protein [Trifolium medium]